MCHALILLQFLCISKCLLLLLLSLESSSYDCWCRFLTGFWHQKVCTKETKCPHLSSSGFVQWTALSEKWIHVGVITVIIFCWGGTCKCALFSVETIVWKISVIPHLLSYCIEFDGRCIARCSGQCFNLDSFTFCAWPGTSRTFLYTRPMHPRNVAVFVFYYSAKNK